MTIIFPSPEWPIALSEKLNSDPKYAEIARKWEGDIVFEILPSGPVKEPIYYYVDLWHGTCRKAVALPGLSGIKSAFILSAPYENMAKIIKGDLDPMQAMLTRKLTVHGNMAVMMRNVPTVLDFVRCAREVTQEILV